jgi:hypothetical protein
VVGELKPESDNLSSIVVVELGAGWPHWLVDYQRAAPNSIVVAQAVGDTPHDFAARALHRIAEAKVAHDRLVRVGVMVCNGEPDPELLTVRRSICTELLGVLMRSGSELVLAVNDRHEGSKHAIFALAGDLCEVVGDPQVSVRVRFFAESGGSGTMPSVAPVADDRTVANLRR